MESQPITTRPEVVSVDASDISTMRDEEVDDSTLTSTNVKFDGRVYTLTDWSVY